MPYEDLPDPRPLGVRFALGPLPRWAALAVCAILTALAIAGFVAAWADPDRRIPWLGGGLAAALAAVHSAVAIRWSDRHRTWPRRRSRHGRR